MGIKNLMTLVKKSQVTETNNIDELKGKRVGVDIHIYIHKYGYRVVKDYLSNLNDEQLFSSNLMSIIRPLEKDSACQEDIKTRDEITEEICHNIINYFNRIEDVKFTFVFDGEDVSILKSHDLKERQMRRTRTIELLKESIDKKDRQLTINRYSALYFHAFHDVHDVMSDLLRDNGNIELIQYDGEAEHFICKAIQDEKLDYILSLDTDVLAIGHDLIIDIGPSVYTIIKYQDLLDYIGLDKAQFTDVCIMSGCDYNNNMKGIGVMKSIKLIQKYGSIDNLPDIHDVSVLNHEKCRRIFNLQQSV